VSVDPTRRPRTPSEIVAGVLAGDRRAVARAISLLEDGAADAAPVIRDLWPHTGRAISAGLTGPPGVGKSTLASALVAHLRAAERTIGVISVDPSSPFTSGALLGDRIRLSEHFLDPGVYIRSMASRGHLGGLAEATFLALRVLDAAGRDVVLIETVGVGQSEIEVASVVDIVVLVLQPGSGDSVQALKAGVMEIPDIICINKKDHPEAKAMRSELRHALSLTPAGLRPTVVETDARSGEGVAELWAAVEERRALLGDEGLEARRRTSLERELRTVAVARAAAVIERTLHERATDLVRRLEARDVDPLAAVGELFAAAFEDARQSV
jgi:LAO/AO transport system kinase